MADSQFEIVKHLLSFPGGTGFHTEINLISWHGKEPKIDIRRWSEGREKMSKGICLTEEEFRQMVEFGKSYFEGGNRNEINV